VEPEPAPAVGGWLREVAAALTGLAAAVRGDEPDAVHRARTMTRRLRAVLAAVPGEPAQRVRAELKRYGTVLGAARDLEVRAQLAAALLAELGEDDETDAAHARLLAGIRALHAGAHRRVVAYLDGPAYARLLGLLDRLLAGWPDGAAATGEGIDELAVEHAARKHARALRYLAESLGDAGTAATGAALQDAFGARRDLELLARSLDGESDASLVRLREAARARAGQRPLR
jgi:CHAD domain-containing protein